MVRKTKEANRLRMLDEVYWEENCGREEGSRTFNRKSKIHGKGH